MRHWAWPEHVSLHLSLGMAEAQIQERAGTRHVPLLEHECSHPCAADEPQKPNTVAASLKTEALTQEELERSKVELLLQEQGHLQQALLASSAHPLEHSMKGVIVCVCFKGEQPASSAHPLKHTMIVDNFLGMS